MAERTRLSRDRIRDAARSVLDEGTPLTLAAVGRALNCSVPAILKHITGLEELRALVAASVLEELTSRITAAASRDTGHSRLHDAAIAYRDFALEQPGGYALAMATRAWDSAAFSAAGDELVRTAASLFGASDLSPDARTDAVRIVRASLHGFVTLEISGGFALDRDPAATYEVLIETLDRRFT